MVRWYLYATVVIVSTARPPYGGLLYCPKKVYTSNMHFNEDPSTNEKSIDHNAIEQLRESIRHKPFESYQSLRSSLEQSGELPSIESYVKELYEQELSEAKFLTSADWKMLSILWLYDPETAAHSVQTYRIARERIDRPIELKEHDIVINLAEEFSREGVNEEVFLRACLLHDIGKLSIPIEVLTNHITDSECADILYENYGSLEDAVRNALSYAPSQELPESAEALLQALHSVHIRPKALVPMRLLLSPGQEESVARGLARHGLTLDDSLLTIMQIHDGYSRSILLEQGLQVESALAGAHHRHREEYSPTPYKITIGTLQVSVDLADIIHLVDVTQAMESRRYYKYPGSNIKVLAVLVEHAMDDLVDPLLTYLWVADEMGKMSQRINPGEESAYLIIKQFLETSREEYKSHFSK